MIKFTLDFLKYICTPEKAHLFRCAILNPSELQENGVFISLWLATTARSEICVRKAVIYVNAEAEKQP